MFAQAKNRLLGAQCALELVVFPVAHRAEQNRIGRFCQRQRTVGQRMAMCFIARAAHRGFFEIEMFAQCLENFDCLRHNFGPYAVARQYRNFHGLSLIVI